MSLYDVPKLLTTAEVCELLGVCDRTLRSHIKAGLLTYVSMGRASQRVHRMFHPDDINAFIEARRVTEVPPQRVGRRRSIPDPVPRVIDFTASRTEQMGARRAAVRSHLKQSAPQES